MARRTRTWFGSSHARPTSHRAPTSAILKSPSSIRWPVTAFILQRYRMLISVERKKGRIRKFHCARYSHMLAVVTVRGDGKGEPVEEQGEADDDAEFL